MIDDDGWPEPRRARISITDPDPGWRRTFDREASLLRRLLRDDLLATEHVGSTAVPGLPAKPIIDILAGLVDPDDVTSIERRLAPVGYVYTPGSTAPAHIFRKAVDGGGPPWTHHLHVTTVGGVHWRRLTAFRDHLRAHPEIAAAYAQLKRDLAGEYAEDPAAYTASKHGFVKAVEADAGVEHPPCPFCTGDA